MKQEFNFQRLNKARLTARTMGLVLPSLWLTSHLYGTTGLAVVGTFTTIFSLFWSQVFYWHAQSGRHHIRRYNESPGQTIVQQKIADKLATTFGMPRVPVVKAANSHGDIASTDRHSIYLSPSLSVLLNRHEMKFVIAHEMTHIRSTSHDQIRLPFMVAARGTAILGIFGTAAHVNGYITLTGDPSLIKTMALSAAAAAGLHLAAKIVSREIEFTCDSNALRATKDIDAARSTIASFKDIEKPPADNVPDRLIAAYYRFFSDHPSEKARLRNLDKTWAAMQAEKAALPAPPSAPGPRPV